jgi:hypothetical protein
LPRSASASQSTRAPTGRARAFWTFWRVMVRRSAIPVSDHPSFARERARSARVCFGVVRREKEKPPCGGLLSVGETPPSQVNISLHTIAHPSSKLRQHALG